MKRWLYRLKWHLAPYINFKSPVHLDIELNTNCNQQCLSCWHYGMGIKRHVMKLIDAQKYLKMGADIGVKSVKFNLRGEPLMYGQIYLAILEASILGYTEIMINTNGIILTPDRVAKLNRAGLTTCIISVDSFDEAIYRKIHNCRGGDFDLLKNNLRYLRWFRSQNKLKFQVKLNYHVNMYNVGQLKDDRVYHADNFSMFPLIIRGTENRKGIWTSVFEDRKRKKRCPQMRRRITITANHKFYPCCMCYNEPDDIRLKRYRDNLTAVWNSPKRKHLMQDYSKGEYRDSCKNCKSGDIFR